QYQRGYVRCAKRRPGPYCWEFLRREDDTAGKRVHRSAVIGTIEQYPTKEEALDAVNGLRMQINADHNRQPVHPLLIADLIDHYVQTELSPNADWHSHATRLTYRYFMKKWIQPHWGKMGLGAVRTIAVQHWLRGLKRADGTPLANPTKAKIRNLFSVLFNHAIRYEWLQQGRNPITLVRQSAMRQSSAEVLDPNEIQGLLLQLDSCFRLMVMLDVTTGLRRSELFALKWLDVDFSNLTIDVQRSVYLGKIGTCKTEASRKPVPLDERVAADLWLWKESTKYKDPSDWIFASPRVGGKQPFWPDIVLQKIIRPAALRAGIRKRIGWHTFRHTYSTLLIANGENVKVVQELMRHASTRFTIEVYTQARIEAKRQAQQRLVQTILFDENDGLAPAIQGDSDVAV
ncbi:MAG TPA: site-specific integrase, partial [Terriglobales bacterium]